jgi:hypothetical protein
MVMTVREMKALLVPSICDQAFGDKMRGIR